MLAVARDRTADAPGSAALEFVRGDALAMPFAGAFDLAVSFGAFGHILRRDFPRFVSQVAAALRPGGHFVFATAPRPPLWSPVYWLLRGFNAAMHVRNWLRAPPFIMYYLTFTLPEALALLQNEGLAIEVHEGRFAWPWTRLRLVVATRPTA
jgi:SAM-dependent methyltransferase